MDSLRNTAVSFALVLSMAVFSQNSVKDSIQVNKYLKEAGKVKAPGVFTITDPKKVAFISAYIDAKNKTANDAKAKAAAEHAGLPGVRYRNGDQTAIGDVVAILRSNDTIKIHELLQQMEYGYDPTDKVHVLDAEIAKLLFDRVNNPATEEETVQFLGYNHIEGSREVFEKRLLSGKSTDEDRIAYWLTSGGQVPKTIDFIADNYKRNPKYLDDKYWIAGTLDDYMEKASEAEKAKILELSYDYLTRYVPVADEAAEASDSAAFQDHFQTFYAIVVRHGKMEKVKPFIGTLVTRYNQQSDSEKIAVADMEQALEMLFIRELQPKRQRDLVLSMMATPDLYFEGLDAMHEVPSLASDPEMIRKAFLLFQIAKERTETDRFVRSFSRMTPADFTTYANGIKSAPLKKELIDVYTINARTFEQNNDYLISLGLTDKKITDDDIAALKKADPDFEKDGSMYGVLRASGIGISFDVETSMIPVDYDNLLTQFSSAAKGKIGPLKMYVQSHYDDKKELYDYRFLVINNNKCFVMVPEDSGDWYDMEAFSKLVGALTAEAKITERFVPIETGDQTAWYVFGQPEKVGQLVDTYKLAAEISPEEE